MAYDLNDAEDLALPAAVGPIAAPPKAPPTLLDADRLFEKIEAQWFKDNG